MARDFERGSSEIITFADPNIGVQGAQTWACWLKLETATDNALFSYGDMTNGRGFTFGINGSSKARVRWFTAPGSAGQSDATTALSNGVWYHLAFTRNQASFSTVRFYLNGVADGVVSSDDPGGLQNSGDDIVLGSKATGDTSGMGLFDGVLAEVCGWHAELTANEILGLRYRSPYTVRPGSIKFYAPLWGVHSSSGGAAGSVIMPFPIMLSAASTTPQEPEFVQNIVGSLTGTVAADHPPICGHTRFRTSNIQPVVAAGGATKMIAEQFGFTPLTGIY